MSLAEYVEGEFRSGFPRLQGARLDASIPIRRAVLDRVLPLLPGLPRGFALLLGPDQQVQVRYGSFYANARLRPDVVLRPTPVVTVELASQLVAWGLQSAGLPPFIKVSGRVLQIWLAEVPALRDLAGLWPSVHHLTCITSPAGLQITAGVSISGPGAAARPARSAPPVMRAGGDRSMTDGRLQAWVRDQLAAGLPAFAGARVTGTVPLPVTVLNELIAQGLADAVAASPSAAPAPRADTGTPDLATLLRLVRHVRVDAAPGVVTLDFEVGVGG